MQWKIELLLLLLHAICCVAVWLGDPDAGAEGKEVSDVSGDFCSVLGCALCAFAALSDLWAGQTMSGRRVWKS